MAPVPRSPNWLNAKGREAIKMAIPGAGRPRNRVFCVSSTLNLAKRMAENTGSRNAKQGRILMPKRVITGLSSNKNS